ncbi:MAG: RNase P subunit p30 family protein [Promethearchaeota archaeon]
MSYFETRLKIKSNNNGEIERKLSIYEEIGVKNIFLEFIESDNLLNFKRIRDLNLNSKMKIYYRLTLLPKNIDDLRKKLKKYQNLDGIIVVESNDKKIRAFAAKDSRVDLISLSNIQMVKELTYGLISLTKGNNSFIEFSLSPILKSNRFEQSKYLRALYKAIQKILKLKGNYIFCGNFDNIYDFRHPRALASVCHTLLGMSLNSAKKGFRENVKLLLQRARNRRDELYFESGVRFIRKEDDNG